VISGDGKVAGDEGVLMTEGLRIGSLFSGYGGLDLAALELFPGSEMAWHCEWEDAPAKILDHHWPGVPNFRDVTQVDWASAPPIDVLTGGFPCQDVSLAGRRAGMTDGTRSGLWANMAEAIRVLRPRYVLIENVRGLLSATATVGNVESESGGVGGRSDRLVLRALGGVLGELADIGYDACWTSIRASDVGAPHHRERVFILATPADTAGIGWDEGRAESAGVEGRPNVVECRDDISADSESVGRATFGQPLGTPTQRSVDRVDSGDDDRIDWGPYGPAIRRWEHLTRPAPAPTEPNRNGKPRLNAEFASWMMGLPEAWVTDPAIGISRADQLKAVGNGVCPQQAVAAFRELLSWTNAGLSV